MVSKKVIVNVKEGIHARPAAEFVKVASQFKCSIIVEFDGMSVNGKSIMGLLMLGLYHGAEINIIASGEEEEKAIQELPRIFENT